MQWLLSGRGRGHAPGVAGYEFFKGVLVDQQDHSPGVDPYRKYKITEDGDADDFFTEGGVNYLTKRIGEWASTWINQQTDPWFAYVPFTAPHPPFNCPPVSRYPDIPCTPGSVATGLVVCLGRAKLGNDSELKPDSSFRLSE